MVASLKHTLRLNPDRVFRLLRLSMDMTDPAQVIYCDVSLLPTSPDYEAKMFGYLLAALHGDPYVLNYQQLDEAMEEFEREVDVNGNAKIHHQ